MERIISNRISKRVLEEQKRVGLTEQMKNEESVQTNMDVSNKHNSQDSVPTEILPQTNDDRIHSLIELMKQWIPVLQWDDTGCTLKPYKPVGESPPAAIHLCLPKIGMEYLDVSDICLLLRALHRLKISVPTCTTFLSSSVPQSMNKLLDEVERWLIFHSDTIQASHMSTLISCLSELDPKLETTPMILNTLIDRVCYSSDTYIQY